MDDNIPFPRETSVLISDLATAMSRYRNSLNDIVRAAKIAHHVGTTVTNENVKYLLRKVFANGWTTQQPFQAPDEDTIGASPKLLIGYLKYSVTLPVSHCDIPDCRARFGTCCHLASLPIPDQRKKGSPVYVRIVPFSWRQDEPIIPVFDTVDGKGFTIPDPTFRNIDRHPDYMNSLNLIYDQATQAHDSWLKSRVHKYNEDLAVFHVRVRLVEQANAPAKLEYNSSTASGFQEIYRHGKEHGLEIFQESIPQITLPTHLEDKEDTGEEEHLAEEERTSEEEYLEDEDDD